MATVSQVLSAIKTIKGVGEAVDWIVAKLVGKDKFIFDLNPLTPYEIPSPENFW